MSSLFNSQPPHNIEVRECSLKEALIEFNHLPLGETKNKLGEMIKALMMELGASKNCFKPPFSYQNYS